MTSPLDLGEHPFVRGVGRLVAVAGPGHDHADGRRVRLQIADLHRRGVRAQQPARGRLRPVRRVAGGAFWVSAVRVDPDRVPHVARGMVARDAQAVEVVRVPLDLGALDDVEAHLSEDALHGATGERDGVQLALGQGARGQRHVDRGGGLRGGGAAAQRLAALVEGRFERVLEPVRALANRGPVRRGQIADAAQDARQQPFAAQVARAPVVQRGRVGRGGRGRDGRRLPGRRGREAASRSPYPRPQRRAIAISGGGAATLLHSRRST